MIHAAPPKEFLTSSASDAAGWNTASHTSSGPGIVLDGVLRGRHRHTVTDGSTKHRYVILFVETVEASKRNFDKATGKEKDPKFESSKNLKKGWLNIYDKSAQSKPDALTPSQVKGLLAPIHSKLPSIGATPKSPTGAVVNVFWADEDKVLKLDLQSDCCVRVKTKGDSPFVHSIGIKEESSEGARLGNMADDKIGDSWTAGLMKGKQEEAPEADTRDGCDDDEWD